MVIDVLGNNYTIEIKRPQEDEDLFKRPIATHVDDINKTIVVCDLRSCKKLEVYLADKLEPIQKQFVRTGIVRAFLCESKIDRGLFGSDILPDANQDISVFQEAKIGLLTDWLAEVVPKIFEAWKEADAI